MKYIYIIPILILFITSCSVKEGLFVEYYENGQKKFEFTFKDGKRVDVIGMWNEDGSMDFSDLTHSFFSLS